MWGTYGHTDQDQIQLIFLLVAVVCIPWMLLPKPLIMIYCSGDHHAIKEEDDDRQNAGKLLSGDL